MPCLCVVSGYLLEYRVLVLVSVGVVGEFCLVGFVWVGFGFGFGFGGWWVYIDGFGNMDGM